MNLIDKIISFFSPRAACGRIYYREMMRNYDAGRLDRYGDWIPPRNASPEETDAPYRSLIRARARDLERNNDVTQGILGTLKRNVVGTGIIPQPLVPGMEEKIKALWRDWIKKENCDITGCSTFYELQKMFVQRKHVDGEIFCLFSVRGKGRVPLQLQMIEPDLLAEEFIKFESGVNMVHGGVEVDHYMRPVAYHFRLDPLKWEITRVPAENVLHSFDKTRPQQVRGISGLSGSMERVRDIGEYIDSELKAARVAAAHTGVVKTAQGANKIGRLPGKKGEAAIELIQPGIINYLRPEEDVAFPPPGRPNVAAGPFVETILRFVGLSSGLSYEQTARDLSKVNYSSARQGHLEDKRTYEDWQRDIINNFCAPVYEVFVDAAVISGALAIPDYWRKREEYTRVRWVTPGWSWIDPQKEAVASASLLDSGLTTREELCGGRGKNWQDVMIQLKREQAFAESIGLVIGQGEGPPYQEEEEEEEAEENGKAKEPVTDPYADDEG
ncbi:MAG: phage portal protein [Synergistaceae bacterium]|nr:phage portal protein [Synergistaceae bacterium]